MHTTHRNCTRQTSVMETEANEERCLVKREKKNFWSNSSLKSQQHLGWPAVFLRRPDRWWRHQRRRWSAGSRSRRDSAAPGWSRWRRTGRKPRWGSRCWSRPRWWRSRPGGPWSGGRAIIGSERRMASLCRHNAWVGLNESRSYYQ